MPHRTIWCMAHVVDEEPVPLFVGREDGTVDKYISILDADLGQPSLVLRGHRKAVTGVVAVSADEVYTCSMDGTVKQWNASSDITGPENRVVRSTDLQAPLRCIAMNQGRIFTGGDNGCLSLVEGERKTSWPGHRDVLSCIAFTSEGLVLTGGYDNQIRVWDLSLGRTVLLLTGHTNHIKCLTVVGGDEDDSDGEATGAILSFSRDRTLKVWAIPRQDEMLEEGPALIDEAPRGTLVSFQEPSENAIAEEEETAQDAPTEGDQEGIIVPEQAANAAEDSKPALDAMPTQVSSPVGSAAGHDTGLPKLAVAAKSAIKGKVERPIRRTGPLGTIEIPESPHCIFQPEESPVWLVGATNGYVWGLKCLKVAQTVLRFVSANQAKVRQELRSTMQTLKHSRILAQKTYRKSVRALEDKLLLAASKARAKKKVEEAEERQAAREARAAALSLRRAARDEKDDDEEEEDEEEDGEVEEMDEESEDLDEEGEESRLRHLSEEQLTELDAFKRAQAAERDTKMETLKKAVDAHVAQVEPLAKTMYHTAREQFYRLPFTTYSWVGKEGVLALTAVEDTVYAAQGDRVIIASVTPGVTRL